MKTHVERGRQAVAEGAWEQAHGALAAARREGPLAPQDVWRLAVASYLVGREEDFLEALRGAYAASLDQGDALEPVRAAFWIGYHLASRGEVAAASGWFGRATRIVEEHGAEGAALGYSLLPLGHRQLTEGDYDASARTLARIVEIGRRCKDDDLTALGVHTLGRALLRLGRIEHGLALLDEAMVAVTGAELSPVASGLICCSALSACREVYALQRAREWTAALHEWCEQQPDMVVYTGPCRLSRAEILRHEGFWAQAIEEARLAVDSFERWPGPGAPGPAFYVEGEVHRVSGRYAAAEEAYRAAARTGREPQPGLSLLRLAQGNAEAAGASLRRALSETPEPVRRVGLLPALVDVLLELGDLDAAAQASQELEEIAHDWPPGVLKAQAAQTRGAILLAAGDSEAALALLRHACQEWDALEAPFEVARVRVRLARACRRLGDEEGAAMELGAARAAFERLGAAPELGRLGDEGTENPVSAGHGLTPREREILAWVATGRTNRAIAAALSISEKTVARHVSNIFAKLGLSTRAAATAYAYEHRLAHPST